MTVYTVHEPPHPSTDDAEWAEQLLFIKDGFSWGAALAPPIWFLYKGEWRGLLGYLALLMLLASVIDASNHATEFQVLFYALNIIVGFEAFNLYRWSHARKGWREIAAVSGRNLTECERRFFEAWTGERRVVAADAPPPRSPATSGWAAPAVRTHIATASAAVRGLRERLSRRFTEES